MSDGYDIRFHCRLQRPEFELDVAATLPGAGITGVLGESGAGKTTLLRCLAGLEPLAQGTVQLGPHTWQGVGLFRPPQDRRIAYVFQEPRLFEHLDVASNLAFAKNRAAPGGLEFDQVFDLLDLNGLTWRRTWELSGGEAQRVAIARALLSNPRLVLMDEPLSALDERRRAEILPVLERLHASTLLPIIYVTHRMDELCRLSDHLLLLHKGRVAASGELSEQLVALERPELSGGDASAVIYATAGSFDEQHQITTLAMEGEELLVPEEVAADTQVRVRVRAADVSLCRERPEGSTILNVLPVVIEAIEQASDAHALVRLKLGQQKLLARVTRRSVDGLALKQGESLFAQIKAVSVRTGPAGTHQG